MNRSKLSQLARVVAIGMLSAVALTAATVKQVHPPAGTTAGPILIAVLGDRYAAGEEQEFDYDVENFFKHGLLVDAYYQQQAGNLKIVTYFEPTPSGQQSNYDFQIATGTGNCAVVDGPDTMEKIGNAVGSDVPFHTIVIGNHPYNFGCTKGHWTFVAVDAVGTDVLQHEFGHLIAGLFDEWSLASNANTVHPGLLTDQLNCAPKPPPAPHWQNQSGITNKEGCDLFGKGVIHPYDDCRMGASHHKEFCLVCRNAMDIAFDDLGNANPANPGIQTPPITNPPNPPGAHAQMKRPRFDFVNAVFIEQPPAKLPPPAAPAPTPRPVLRLLMQFDPIKRTLVEKKQTFANGIYIPSYRRLGQYMWEVLDNNATLEVGVFPDHLFEARGYRGGAQHGTSDPQPTDVIVAIPNEDQKTLALPNRRFEMVVYRIPPTVKISTINRGQFSELKKANVITRVAGIPLTLTP